MRIIKQKGKTPRDYKAVFLLYKEVLERGIKPIVVKTKIREHVKKKFCSEAIEVSNIYYAYNKPHVVVELASHEKILYVLYQKAN